MVDPVELGYDGPGAALRNPLRIAHWLSPARGRRR